MQIIAKFNIWIYLILICIISNFMSIHYCCWNFYTSTEVYICVTKVISKCLDILLFEPSSVPYYLILYWLSSCDGSFMRNQEKVKFGISLAFNKSSVNYCSWARVYISIAIVFVKKSMRNPFINKTIKKLWHIIGSIIWNRSYYLF